MSIHLDVESAMEEFVLPLVRKMAANIIDEEIRICQKELDKRLADLAAETARNVQVMISKMPDSVKTKVDITVALRSVK